MTDNAAPITFRQAKASDIDGVVALFGANRQIFGFLPRATYLKAQMRQQLLVALQGDEVVGAINYYHHTLTRNTTLYDICVAEAQRGQGVGRALFEVLLAECRILERDQISAKCPMNLPSNGFWQHMGFTMKRVDTGRMTPLHVWVLRLAEKPEPVSLWGEGESDDPEEQP